MDATQGRLDAECLMAANGTAVTVYSSPTDVVGRACTGIVSYGDSRAIGEPRGLAPAVRVALYNSAVDGLSVTERTELHEVAVPESPGSATTVRRRITRRRDGNNPALINWELG